jgi:arginine exporter protein ArgO
LRWHCAGLENILVCHVGDFDCECDLLCALGNRYRQLAADIADAVHGNQISWCCLSGLSGLISNTGKTSPISISRLDGPPQKEAASFSALSLQLTNPKILLTFVAILPQFIDQHEAVGLQMLILAICSIIPEFFILLGYGVLASKASHWATQEKYAVMTERIAGVLILCAATLVATV